MIERRPHWDDALIEAVTALVSDLASRHEAGDLDYYRVQSDRQAVVAAQVAGGVGRLPLGTARLHPARD